MLAAGVCGAGVVAAGSWVAGAGVVVAGNETAGVVGEVVLPGAPDDGVVGEVAGTAGAAIDGSALPAAAVA